MTPVELEKLKKDAERLKMARNRALALIKDAQNRYIKEKTRAKSRKAAEEKNAILESPRFKVLDEYDRRGDILEAYGCGVITESESDRLEELWDEREAIRNKTFDGVYQDEVTDALRIASEAISDLWEKEIENAEDAEREFKDELLKANVAAEKWNQRQNEAYSRLFGD